MNGVQHKIKVVDTAGVLELVSFEVEKFNHDATLTTPGIHVSRSMIIGSESREYVVKLCYPQSSAPSTSGLTIATILGNANSAINATYGGAELDATVSESEGAATEADPIVGPCGPYVKIT